MAFRKAMMTYFPGTILEREFVKQTYRILANYGFTGETTIASLGVCRDELTRSLLDEVQALWGKAFSFSALGGMMLLGKTGFLAAAAHSPNIDGKERYLYMAMPHIGIGQDGTPGLCYRPGREKPSSACGALVAFQKELLSGQVNLQTDPLDLEQSLLKQRLISKFNYGNVPNLVTLTKLAHDAIVEDLTRMIASHADPAVCDIAVLTGVQIHGADGQNYVWPRILYAVVDGEKKMISL